LDSLLLKTLLSRDLGMFQSSPIAPQAEEGCLPRIEQLPDRRHLTSQHCTTCELLLANPLGHLQSLVKSPGSLKSLHVERSIEDWKSGAEIGCLLCRLVTALCQELGRNQNFELPQEVQVLVSPIRENFPHLIQVVGYGTKDELRVKLWDVELYTTKGESLRPLHGICLYMQFGLKIYSY
jgi:hypothetical protein